MVDRDLIQEPAIQTALTGFELITLILNRCALPCLALRWTMLSGLRCRCRWWHCCCRDDLNTALRALVAVPREMHRQRSGHGKNANLTPTGCCRATARRNVLLSHRCIVTQNKTATTGKTSCRESDGWDGSIRRSHNIPARPDQASTSRARPTRMTQGPRVQPGDKGRPRAGWRSRQWVSVSA